jgi:antirestriction protein ArdC
MAAVRVVPAAKGPIPNDLLRRCLVPVLLRMRAGEVAMSIRPEELHHQLLDQVRRLRTSEEWLQAMITAARFQDYSLGNWLLLWAQAEQRGTTITRPAGYRRWQELSRHVFKGETGYRILAPVIRKVAVDQGDTEQIERRLVGFRVVTVFDIAQTDGDPLPDVGPRRLTGSGNVALLEAGISMIEEAGYRYSLAPLRGPNGVTRPGSQQVIVEADLDGAQLTKTTIHELAHVHMHAADGHIACRGRIEVEAESVAYVVCGAVGLDTSEYSVAYVARWADRTDDPDRTLLAAGDRIVAEARRVIAYQDSESFQVTSHNSQLTSFNRLIEGAMIAVSH